MILNWVEFALVTNRVRPAFLRAFEAPRLLAMGGRLAGGAALEIGCGSGFGLWIIPEVFGADRVDGFDLDPRMVALARARHRGNRKVSVWVGDASSIAVADATYDAVFDFGIVHHILDWPSALREIARVLKPGGRLYTEEVLEKFILNPVIRRVLDHPLQNRFDADMLEQELVACGLRVLNRKDMDGAFTWIVAVKP